MRLMVVEHRVGPLNGSAKKTVDFRTSKVIPKSSCFARKFCFPITMYADNWPKSSRKDPVSSKFCATIFLIQKRIYRVVVLGQNIFICGRKCFVTKNIFFLFITVNRIQIETCLASIYIWFQSERSRRFQGGGGKNHNLPFPLM